MFERFTEKARRVVFFARFEASRWGSPTIETEHLLFGLLREDPGLITAFTGHFDFVAKIRGEVEERITLRERIPTSVEMQLSADNHKILTFAAEEADRLAARLIGTCHLLIAMLRVETSVAGEVLLAQGLTAAKVREKLPKSVVTNAGTASKDSVRVEEQRAEKARLALDAFIAGLKWHGAEELIKSFAKNARFIDVMGNIWNREEIHKNFESLFAPYAKKNAAPHVEKEFDGQREHYVAIVLWKNAVLASMERIWIHRMSIVLVNQPDAWRILLIQVTPVQRPLVETGPR
jgi:ATP-dependent Clp protease ATP-binding subunit ClpA